MSQSENKFERHFESQWGDRWPKLFKRLKEPAPKAHLTQFLSQLLPASLDIPPSVHKLESEYLLDPASIYPVLALEPWTGSSIIDLCAAPGGKSLVIASLMREDAKLTSNDMSSERFNRLKRNIQQCAPKEKQQQISTSKKDAHWFGKSHLESFDRVLLDAPCSNERHVLHSPEELEKWSETRSAFLAKRQRSLLGTASKLLKPKGRLVYSTCSISTKENDGVIKWFLDRNDGFVTDQTALYPGTEMTDFGFQILPDYQGWGPIYFALLRKD